MISYPQTLPKPLQAEFSLKYQPNLLKDGETSGYVDQRLLTFGNHGSLSTAIMINTIAEYETWLEFIDNLNDGTDWFSITMLGTNYKARIQSGKWNESLNCRTETKIIRKITFTLDLEVL